MKFVDEVNIEVVAGKGGHGCLSFRREKSEPYGGPNGGDGGQGADIYLVAEPRLNTLIEFQYKPYYKAPNGQPGSGRNKTGISGENLEIPVPLGTVVKDFETQEIIGDLNQKAQRLLVARGGRLGLGNTHFKSSTNQAPRKTTEGSLGEKRSLHLELKLLADVGLLGLPNAGKSTFIRAVSAARPKVADYPFTTRTPVLGVVRIDSETSFVIADIPGLIEGAHRGVGIGDRFLKHLSRTRLLLHIVDCYEAGDDILDRIQVIQRELIAYDPEFSKKPQWILLNKIDLIDKSCLKSWMEQIKIHFNFENIYSISSVNREGVAPLLKLIALALRDVCVS